MTRNSKKYEEGTPPLLPPGRRLSRRGPTTPTEETTSPGIEPEPQAPVNPVRSPMYTDSTDDGWVMWDGGAGEGREPVPPLRVSVPVYVPVPETDDWLIPPSEASFIIL